MAAAIQQRPAKLPRLGAPKWKDPERRDSILRSSNVKMQWQVHHPLWLMTCWIAIPPARASLIAVITQIESLVEKRKCDIWEGEKTSPGCAWDRSMHGRSINDAQPTVIFSSTSRICRKNAKRIIQEENIQVDPRGIGIEYYETGPKFLAGNLDPPTRHIPSKDSLTLTENSSSLFSLPGFRTSPGGQQLSWNSGSSFSITGLAVSIGQKSSTLGGVLSINNTLLALTVAHVFEEQVEDSTDPLSVLPVLSAPHIEHKIVGHVASLQQKRTIKDGNTQPKPCDSDWAICALNMEELNKKRVDVSNRVHLPNGNILVPKRFIEDPTDSEVWVNTGPSGAVKGFLMRDYSLVSLPGRKSFQRMWLVVMERHVEMGDCGAWVLDSASGDWVGHVVAGKIGTGVAYIILARDIVQDVSDQLGFHLVDLPQEPEFAPTSAEDAKGTLPDTGNFNFHEHGTRYDHGNDCQYTHNGKNPDLAHGSDVEGRFLHYSGCLKLSEQNNFRDSLPDHDPLKHYILQEQARVTRLRNIFEMEGFTSPNGQLLRRFRQTLSFRFPGPNRSYSDLTLPDGRERGLPTPDLESLSNQVIMDDLDGNVVYFKEGYGGPCTPYDHPELRGSFPNQKVSLGLLLSDSEENPLKWPCEDGMIRWFHIPANNMLWIEEVIAKYYHEQGPNLQGPYREPLNDFPDSNARRLLRPQFWGGLQNGDRPDLPVHARHMRPRCHSIPMGHDVNNIALFMPYLHWETDRKRAKASEIIADTASVRKQPSTDMTLAPKLSAVEASTRVRSSGGVVEDATTRKRFRGALLGNLLLDAAKLYENMDGYTDEKLMRNYLTSKPPLHPRRTLDQSYYWTLKQTNYRDKDQIVYRGTAPHSESLHHACGKNTTSRSLTCVQCTEDIKKIPRLVMVDQLWMWILDENTIITSFPERWGRNSSDSSDIHACIRKRLKLARTDEIRSVYDIGLIIIDQCSRVFFDREQSRGLQPQVMDAFASAIGRVTQKQTIAFDHFWTYTRLSSRAGNSRDDADTAALREWEQEVMSLDPEGTLLREMKDILDELSIMMGIMTQQEAVARTFVKNIQRLKSASRSSSIRNQSANEKFVLLRPGSDIPGVSLDNLPDVAETIRFPRNSTEDLLDALKDRKEELQFLQDAAEQTTESLKDLLELKQQQAGVLEAREAVKTGEEIMRQGRSIMMFTVVTIIFLPLTFFTAIFGMNVTELNGSREGDTLYRWPDAFKIMLPTSFLVVVVSLLLSFSSLTRASLSFIYHVSLAWLSAHITPYAYFSRKQFSGDQIKHREKASVNEIKKKAMERKARRKVASTLRQRKMEDLQNETSDRGRTNSYDDENFEKEA